MSATRNAVILAAGEGKRLLPFTLTAPKSFARVGGVSIIENALHALAAHGCREVCIVIGHHGDLMRQTLTERYAGMTVRYVVNPIYQTTNSMYSLALGLEEVEEPAWVLEGDIFLAPSLLGLQSRHEIGWFVDSTTRELDGAFVEADERGVAHDLSIVRDLRLLRPRQCKSVGILRLSTAGVSRLRQWLQQGIAAGRQNVYYDLIIADHLGEGCVGIVDVAGQKWFEIDSHADLEAATRIFGA